MKKIILLFSILFSAYCFSQEWELVASAENGDNYYMKRKKENSWGNPKVWTKSTYKLFDFTNPPTKNATVMSLEEYDCSERTIQRLSFISYDSKGNVIDSFDFQQYDNVSNVVPDSIAETQLHFVCKNIK